MLLNISNVQAPRMTSVTKLKGNWIFCQWTLLTYKHSPDLWGKGIKTVRLISKSMEIWRLQTKTRGRGWHSGLHELDRQTVSSKHNTWETPAQSRCAAAPYPAAEAKCAGWLPQGKMCTPRQWEISPPGQSHRQDRIAGHIFSNILSFYSIFPLWTALQNANHNHMAVKS